MNGDVIWYVAVNGQRVGPLSQSKVLEKLRGGEISCDDYIFTEGMDGWVTILTRKEFSEICGQVPPPPPPPSRTLGGVTQSAYESNGRFGASRFSFWRVVLTLLCGLAGFYFVVYVYQHGYPLVSQYPFLYSLFSDQKIALLSGVSVGVFLGLLLFRPFKKRTGRGHIPSNQSDGFSLSGFIGVLLGVAGLYAAYYTYNPPQFEPYNMVDGMVIGGYDFGSEQECRTWADNYTAHMLETMRNNPNTPYSEFRGVSCRRFCADKLSCLMRKAGAR